MPNSQIVCPHCGSTLTFGAVIDAGTPLTCLICTHFFVAENPIASTTPCDGFPSSQTNPLPPLEGPTSVPPVSLECPSTICEDPATCAPATVPLCVADTTTESAAKSEGSTCAVEMEKPKRAPRSDVLVAKPFSPPTGAMAEKLLLTSSDPSHESDARAPSIASTQQHRQDSDPVRRVILIGSVVGLLLLLTCSIVYAAWAVTRLARHRSTSASFALKDTPPPGPSELGAYNGENEKPKPLAPLTAEEEDELRERIQTEIKQTLKRKSSTQIGADPEIGPITQTAAKQPVAGLDQDRINAAIDKGVAHLRRTQTPEGTWSHGNSKVGYAAIGGLTLLECDAPADDPNVQKAAKYVRFHANNLSATYELALAILFLDRLADPRDRPLIQGMALRLLAGQNDAGGWTYQCPVLNSSDMFQLYSFLQSNKQPNLLNPLGGASKTQSGIALNPKRQPSQMNDAFAELNEMILTKGIDASTSGSKPPAKKDAPNPEPKNPRAQPAVKPIPPGTLPPNLQKLPIVRNQGMIKSQTKIQRLGGDNSNTQFAMLALWAARRHNVPTDQALLASFQRFQATQNAEGGWGYVPGAGSTPSMINVGLLGLAMGHGAAPEVMRVGPMDFRVKPALQDPSIQKGLHALSRHIGALSNDPTKTTFPMENLYFLWSVERVAMLYDLKTVGGKDWYAWGAQILVHNQAAGGEWPTSSYPGQTPPINTCFALLFLRRSNLVQDLTQNLRLTTGIADSKR